MADIFDYEADEYALASREIFYDEEAAISYARDLAKRHRLKFEGDKKEHDYLD